MKLVPDLKVMVVLIVPCMKVVFSPMHGESAVPGQHSSHTHKPVELSTEVVFGGNEEQLLEVPGLLVRENFRGTSTG